MNRDEEYHVKIRETVMVEAMRLAKEAWPIGSNDLHMRLAVNGVRAALLQLDPCGRRAAPSGPVEGGR